MRGMPRLPSNDSSSADSSPHSYAPAPVVRGQIEIEAACRDVVAQIAARVGFVDGAIHDVDQIAILAADVDVTLVRLDRAGPR